MQKVFESVLDCPRDTDNPTLSVVVIGRNEGARLAKCLNSIQKVEGVSVKEIIYVDSASTDDSPELASLHGATVIVVQSERPTAALGRNAGWRAAQSDLVLFLDGDTVLHADFPRWACDALSLDRSIAAVWGHRREIHPEASIFNRILDLDWMYKPGFTEFCGGDVLIRRKVLSEVDGFDEKLIAGEEPELCRRMRAGGYKVLHIDHPMTGHDLEITRLSQYWKRATRAGHAYAEVSERYMGSEDPSWTSERRGNLIRGIFWPFSLVSAILLSIQFGFLAPALWLTVLLLASARSAWKARWKETNPWILLLYGIHSHLQQAPILVGQFQYELDKRQGRTRKLIEYKADARGLMSVDKRSWRLLRALWIEFRVPIQRRPQKKTSFQIATEQERRLTHVDRSSQEFMNYSRKGRTDL
jgi:glycosyltransferase involved in cell wall biosynthesis